MTYLQRVRSGSLPALLSVDEVYALTEAGVFTENEKIELIDGEIVPMAAAKANWHSMMEARLNRGLVRALPDDVRVYPAPSITLSKGTLLEPDLVVLPKGSMVRDMRGPDLLLAIEVADSSIGYDLRVKAPLYARHEVGDYWVVDAVRQTIRVHRHPTGGQYAAVEEFEADQPVAALLLPGVVITLADLD